MHRNSSALEECETESKKKSKKSNLLVLKNILKTIFQEKLILQKYGTQWENFQIKNKYFQKQIWDS